MPCCSLLGRCYKPESNNPPCLSRVAWYTLCRTPPYPSRCLGVDNAILVHCLGRSGNWPKKQPLLEIFNSRVVFICFLHPNDGSHRSILYTRVYNLVCSKDAELLVLQRSHIVSHFIAFFAFAACLKATLPWQNTHTAADGIRQFPTTNKHPTSSDECHFDMIFTDFPPFRPAGSGDL